MTDLTNPSTTYFAIKSLSGSYTHSSLNSISAATPSWANTQKVVNCTADTTTKWKIVNFTVVNNIFDDGGINGHGFQLEYYRNLHISVGVGDKNDTAYAWLVNGLVLPAGSAQVIISAKNPVWLRHNQATGEPSKIGIHFNDQTNRLPQTPETNTCRFWWYCTYEQWGTF